MIEKIINILDVFFLIVFITAVVQHMRYKRKEHKLEVEKLRESIKNINAHTKDIDIEKIKRDKLINAMEKEIEVRTDLMVFSAEETAEKITQMVVEAVDSRINDKR